MNPLLLKLSKIYFLPLVGSRLQAHNMGKNGGGHNAAERGQF
jgi:hypothetical protein